MKVLGISPLDKDSTVTVVDDGRITYAAAEEQTRLFERNLAKEKDFLDYLEIGATSDELREARTRVPSKRDPVPGLTDPNERMEKGLLKSMAYRLLASEGVVSRNVAKRESNRWGRDASK